MTKVHNVSGGQVITLLSETLCFSTYLSLYCLLAKRGLESTSSGMWKVSGFLPREICHAVIQKWQAVRVQPLEFCQFEIFPVKLTSCSDPKMASRSSPDS